MAKIEVVSTVTRSQPCDVSGRWQGPPALLADRHGNPFVTWIRVSRTHFFR